MQIMQVSIYAGLLKTADAEQRPAAWMGNQLHYYIQLMTGGSLVA